MNGALGVCVVMRLRISAMTFFRGASCMANLIVSNQMYFESQVGGHCRVHATNMLLGRPAFSPPEFYAHAKAFAEMYDLPSDTVAHDYVTDDGLLLPSFVVERHHDPPVVTLAVTPGSARLWGYDPKHTVEFLLDMWDPESPGAFVFSPTHIWCVRRPNSDASSSAAAASSNDSAASASAATADAWYVCDSMSSSGPSRLESLERALRHSTGGSAVLSYVLVYTLRGARQILLPRIRRRLVESIQEGFPTDVRPVYTDIHARTVAFACMGDIGIFMAYALRVLYALGYRAESRELTASLREMYPTSKLDREIFQESVGRVLDSVLDVIELAVSA